MTPTTDPAQAARGVLNHVLSRLRLGILLREADRDLASGLGDVAQLQTQRAALVARIEELKAAPEDQSVAMLVLRGLGSLPVVVYVALAGVLAMPLAARFVKWFFTFGPTTG